jgi:hypothetical protein
MDNGEYFGVPACLDLLTGYMETESDGLLPGLLSLLISQIEMNVVSTCLLYMLTEIVVEERIGNRRKFQCGRSADPDPAFYLNAESDSEPRSQTNKDPCRSGSWSDFKGTKK